MKRIILTIIFLIAVEHIFAQPDWPAIKSSAMPTVSIPSEFTTPFKQPLSVDGWEDGIFITRDGLNLYCVYVPVDFFSWTFVGPADPSNFSPYSKGPTFGMDLVSNPFGASEWLQGDILYSHRTSTADSFYVWQLSNLANPVFSEGAPQTNNNTSTLVDLFVYTTNNHPPDNNPDIVLLRNVGLNPSVQDTLLPSPVSSQYTEDNPHIERIDSLNIVLFFDSGNRPGGVGQLDIWYTTSNDNGITWTNPLQVSTLNTTMGEQQPHLYKDNNADWYIYYTGTNTTTGKFEIYRAKQGIIGNWNSWINDELVIGAGNTASIGEPTLTQNGDISFVVVYSDTVNGTPTDKYDADPWFLPKSGLTTTSLENNFPSMLIYPNPSSGNLNLRITNGSTKPVLSEVEGITTGLYESTNCELKIFDMLGQEVFQSEIKNPKSEINLNLPGGIYFYQVKDKMQRVGNGKIIIQ